MRVIAVFLFGCLFGTAQADSSLFMWGVGGTVSTVAWPGATPISYPTVTDELLANCCDPRENLDKSRGDVSLAGRTLLYLRRKERVGARIQYGGGSGFRQMVATIEYEHSILRADYINVFVGGGIGVGSLVFDQGDAGTLRTSTYNTRMQIAGTFRHEMGRKNKADDRAYEIALFVTPFGGIGPESYHVGDEEIDDPESANPFASLTDDEGDDQLLSGGLYNPTIGIEASVYFGDFTPPVGR